MFDQIVATLARWATRRNVLLLVALRALLDQRTAPTSEDVREVSLPILRHRIIVNHRAVGDGVTAEDIIAHLIKTIPA